MVRKRSSIPVVKYQPPSVNIERTLGAFEEHREEMEKRKRVREQEQRRLARKK